MTTFKASVEKVAKEAGWIKEWSQEDRLQERLENSKQIAKKMLVTGMTVEQIAQLTDLPSQTILDLKDF